MGETFHSLLSLKLSQAYTHWTETCKQLMLDTRYIRQMIFCSIRVLFIDFIDEYKQLTTFTCVGFQLHQNLSESDERNDFSFVLILSKGQINSLKSCLNRSKLNRKLCFRQCTSFELKSRKELPLSSVVDAFHFPLNSKHRWSMRMETFQEYHGINNKWIFAYARNFALLKI